MIDSSFVLYEDIASEYYDPVRHPTCANFREASAIVLRGWLEKIPVPEWSCDVGAGKSLLAELLAQDRSGSNLIITDSSPSMLSYSLEWAEKKTHLVRSDALALPFKSEAFGLLVSSLGDPYNVPQFWNEVYRVLRPGGHALFTTPSHGWATSFRNKQDRDQAVAEFELLGGESVLVSSWIYDSAEQTQMVEKSGLRVTEYVQVPLSALVTAPISPKLLPSRGPDANVVEGYLVAKPALT